MHKTFHPPVTQFEMCNARTRAAIDRVMEASSEPACIRIDTYIADTDTTVVENIDLLLYRGESAHRQKLETLSDPLRSAFLEVLGVINDDVTAFKEKLAGYPLPWTDGSYCDSQCGRYLSVLFFADGLGAVIQEYLPTWAHEDPSLLEPGLAAANRAQLMSVFHAAFPSNHEKRALQKRVNSHHPMMKAMFELHADHDIDAALGEIDVNDRF